MKEYDDRNKLTHEEKHKQHFIDRQKAPAGLIGSLQKHLKPGSKPENVLKEGSTHQDIQGSSDVPAAHTLGLGIKKGALKKHVKPEGHKEIIDRVAHTNPADKASNLNIERSMDKHMLPVVKDHFNNNPIDVKAVAQDLSDRVNTDVKAKLNQPMQTRGAKTYAIYGPIWESASKEVQNPSSIKKSSKPPSKKSKKDSGNTVSAGAA